MRGDGNWLWIPASPGIQVPHLLSLLSHALHEYH